MDGLYEIVKFDKENLKVFIEKLNDFSKNTDVDIFMGLDMNQEELPEGLEVEVQVL